MRNERSFCSGTRPLRDDSRSPGVNTTTAFLCLGSLGDCLPLCALAASLPSHVHSRHDPNRVDERRRHGGDKDRLSRLPEVARCGATGDDGADCPNETVSLDTMRCVLVTHRCHSDLLRGEYRNDHRWCRSCLHRRGDREDHDVGSAYNCT